MFSNPSLWLSNPSFHLSLALFTPPPWLGIQWNEKQVGFSITQQVSGDDLPQSSGSQVLLEILTSRHFIALWDKQFESPSLHTYIHLLCDNHGSRMPKKWKEEFDMDSTLPEEFDSQILCKWITAIQCHLSLIRGLETGAKFTPGEPGAVGKHSPGFPPLPLIWNPSHLQAFPH